MELNSDSCRLSRGVNAGNTGGHVIKLPFRPPYNWPHMLDFLALRATPGVERVTCGEYARTIGTVDHPGLIRIRCEPNENQLICNISMAQPECPPAAIEKIKRIFDLEADPKTILARLKCDRTLWRQVKINPGLRVPGCWDGFEIAVRSITGQQISVAGATTVMGKIVAQYGQPVRLGAGLEYLFPTPRALADLDPGALPMPKARAHTIASVAAMVASGDLSLEPGHVCTDLVETLLSVKGIGSWTAQYIAMRALSQADALLEGDLVLEKKAARLYGLDQRMKTKELLQRAEAWRPWRAYASMHIWNL